MPKAMANKVVTLNDDDYFASLDSEQKRWYDECVSCPKNISLTAESTVNCTCCNKKVQIQVI